MSGNALKDINPEIKSLPMLTFLDLSKNPDLYFLPENFCSFTKLAVLNLADTGLSELPKEFGRLVGLQKLELRLNRLSQLPPSFSKLSRLQMLDLGENELCYLPVCVTTLSNLTELYIDRNQLKDIPNEVERLTKLRILDASENIIELLPDSFQGLANLTDLSLRINLLEAIPDCIGHLTSLEMLDVSKNQIMDLSPRIGQCLKLIELHLSENFLTVLPDEIGNFRRLEFLDVSRNRLSVLPKQIGRCSQLSILMARENRIRLLPNEIGCLTKLTVLNMAVNKLSYFPNSLLNCTSLTSLWITANQENSAVKLQEDKDPRTGQSFLTCYLLPQDDFNPNSAENIPELLYRSSRTNLYNSGSGLNKLPANDSEANQMGSATSLASEMDESRSRYSYIDEEGKRVRIPHPKLDKRAVDGHIILKDIYSPPKDTKFAPGRATPPPVSESNPNEEQQILEIKNNFLRKISAPAMSINNRHSTPAAGPEIDLRRSGADSSGDFRAASNQRQSAGNYLIGYDAGRPQQPTRKTGNTSALPSNNTNSPKIPSPRSTPRQPIDDRPGNIRASTTASSTHPTSIQQTSTSPLTGSPRQSDSSANQRAQQSRVSGGALSQQPPLQQPPANLKEQILEIQIRRQPKSGLGISIAGGIGSDPYRGSDFGIFVSKCAEDKPGFQSGLLVGDKILQVNGTSLENVEHHFAVNVLRRVGDEIDLTVARLLPVEANQKSPSLHTSKNNNNNHNIETIRINRNGNHLGLTVIGGRNQYSHPFGVKPGGIFVSKISPGGAASQCAQLRLGDRILQVAGHDLSQATREEALHALIAGHAGDLEMVVQHQSPLAGLLSVSSVLKASQLAGLWLAGPLHQQHVSNGSPGQPAPFISANLHDAHDDGLFISRVASTSAAARLGLRVGQRLLELDGQSMLGLSCEDAVSVFARSPEETSLLVCDGLQPADLDRFLKRYPTAEFCLDPRISQSAEHAALAPLINGTDGKLAMHKA